MEKSLVRFSPSANTFDTSFPYALAENQISEEQYSSTILEASAQYNKGIYTTKQKSYISVLAIVLGTVIGVLVPIGLVISPYRISTVVLISTCIVAEITAACIIIAATKKLMKYRSQRFTTARKYLASFLVTENANYAHFQVQFVVKNEPILEASLFNYENHACISILVHSGQIDNQSEQNLDWSDHDQENEMQES
jgi:hypothetical protein